MITVLIAVIGALATILAATLPVVVVTRRTRGAASSVLEAAEGFRVAVESSGPTTEAVLAAVNRLEGKVDGVRESVGQLLDWKAIHEAQHAHAIPHLVAAEDLPATVVARRRRR